MARSMPALVPLIGRGGALALGMALVLFGLAPDALAQTMPVSDADLIAKATAEGSVVVYAAIGSGDLQKLSDRFGAAYPSIKLQTLRLISDQLPAKLTIEQRAGVYAADAQIGSGYPTDQLKRSGALVPFRPPEAKDYLAGFSDPDGYWYSGFVQTETIAYNTERLSQYGIKPPTSWRDLTKPEWRGRLVLFNGSYEWYSAMHRALGNAAADALMKGIAANNPHMVGSHQLAIDQTAAGEYAAGVNVYGYNAARYKHQGRPVELLNADPVIGELVLVALVKNAPHPNAARLFIRWLLSRDTQQWLVSSAGLGRISARKDVASDPEIWSPRLKIIVSNPANSVNYADDARAFNATFGISQ